MTALDLVSVDQAFAWRPWAVAYFLVIGAGVGAALAAQALHLLRGAEAGRSALRVAAVLALSAPLPLLADLHQPARFLNFYLGAAPNSVMWWGAWLLPAFVATTLLATVTDALGRWNGTERLLRLGMVGSGLGVLAYTAGETAIVAARPLWHNAGFPVVLTLTALVSGVGAVLIAGMPDHAGTRLLRRALAGTAAAGLVALGLWLLADPDMARLALAEMPVAVLVHVAALGLVLPALLALFGQGTLSARLAGAAAIWGALAFRWALFNGAQAQSRVETATYMPPALTDPATLQSVTGTAGMIALAAVLVAVLDLYLAPALRRSPQADPRTRKA
ncbi:MAG: NrfD/PsrC family molybdoenzyme membrane anchor subunit [Roseicyclus sp.]